MSRTNVFWGVLALCFGLVVSCVFAEETPAPISKMTLSIDGKAILPSNGTVAGIWFFADFEGEKETQLLLLGHPNAGPEGKPNYRLLADLAPNEQVTLTIPAGSSADLEYAFSTEREESLACAVKREGEYFHFSFSSNESPLFVAFSNFQSDGVPVSLDPVRRKVDLNPISCSPNMTAKLADALVEWDWRMWDGIETPLESRTFRQAIPKLITEGESMISDLVENADSDEDAEVFEKYQNQWKELADQFAALDENDSGESLWRNLHQLRREVILANPKFKVGPLVFAKRVPSAMSHQLTQSLGFLVRPGGGIFVLDRPGESMDVRSLTADFPMGGYMYPSVSYDGKSIFFSYCEADLAAETWRFPSTMDQYFHLWKIDADGKNPRQMTEGHFDDLAPRELPDGKVIFSSTRRCGFHRCGAGPCPVFTLALMNADGTDPHSISYHETHEWTPDVMNDGRVIYTRWDYVDRNAVHYQDLWSTRQDGTDVRIFYGNNTLVPCGIWEPKSIPGSSKVMAIAGPHHGESAGSVILIDNTLGVDGDSPVTRLTPDVPYPEAENTLPSGATSPQFNDFDDNFTSGWHAELAPPVESVPEEALRWPVHVFKSPYPLSETYFIASYSFDKLLGEPSSNFPNQFGIYFCDSFGNRELIYRDMNISSLWASPLAPRIEQPKYVSLLPEPTDENGNLKPGHFFIQNIYESWPFEIPKKIKSLRIVQVLPKTTPDANTPKVGAANASPGKQVLGTVPVEEDGSAQFVVPARKPFLIQALDEDGRMVEGMRSLIYAQPGETVSCTGCHENRLDAVSAAPTATIASRKTEPQQLIPGPDGSKPLSYPILVQPVLDKNCVACHNDDKAEGGINLTGTPEKNYTKSYNTLIDFVDYTYWGAPDNNREPMTLPLNHGTPKSKLIEILDAGHYDVKLTDEDWERLCTWIDGGNALFYGTFNIDDQKRQQNGERIEGPELE